MYNHYDHLTLLDTEGNYVESEQVELSARGFAEVTHAAREMAELMQQPFLVRLKDKGLGFSVNPEKDAKLLSKWVEVKVDWGTLERVGGEFIKLNLVDEEANLYPNAYLHAFLLTPDEFKQHITQKGMAPKMFSVWEQCVKARTKS